MFKNFASISAKGSNGSSKESWSLAQVLTGLVLWSQVVVDSVGNVKLDPKGNPIKKHTKEGIAQAIGRSVHAVGYKIFEDKTTSAKGVTQCRGVRKYMYLDPTSPTNHAMLNLADEEERNQIFQNVFEDFKQGKAFEGFEESVLPLVTEVLVASGFLQPK